MTGVGEWKGVETQAWKDSPQLYFDSTEFITAG